MFQAEQQIFIVLKVLFLIVQKANNADLNTFVESVCIYHLN